MRDERENKRQKAEVKFKIQNSTPLPLRFRSPLSVSALRFRSPSSALRSSPLPLPLSVAALRPPRSVLPLPPSTS
jgi:hypothetical protein